MRSIIIVILAVSLSILALADYSSIKVARIVSNGEIVKVFPVDSIEYIEFLDLPSPPADFNARAIGTRVSLSWTACEDESITFNVYHSTDGIRFDIIGAGLTDTAFLHASPPPTSNYYAVSASIDGIEGARSEVREINFTPEILPPGCYADISCYYSSHRQSNLKSISNEGVKYLKSYIYGLGQAGYPVHYYLLETALDSLNYCAIPQDLANISIISIFNNTDKKSLSLNDSYQTNEQYRSALSNRINNLTISGIPVESYALGVFNKHTASLQELRNEVAAISSPGCGTTVVDIDYLNRNMEDIARKIASKCLTDSRDLSICLSNLTDGQRIRISLDYTDKTEDSCLYIEATYSASDISLTDISCSDGIQMATGKTLNGSQEGLFVNFTFNDVKIDDAKTIAASNVKVWLLTPRTSDWKLNTLFDINRDLRLRPHNKSAVIKILLDHSAGLGEDYDTIRAAIAHFFDTLNEQIGEEVDRPFWSEIAGPRNIRNVLFFGNSFLCPQGVGNNEWYRLGAMAPSVAEHAITSLTMRGIRQKYPEASYITLSSSPWEVNHMYPYFSYQDLFAKIDGYHPDIVYLWISDNGSYTEKFLPESRKLLDECTQRWPEAEIYLIPSWHNGPKYADMKTACDDTRIQFIDARKLKSAEHIWQPGDYYYAEERDEYFGLKYTVVNHPNDVGSMEIANKFLQFSGFDILDLAHDIHILALGEGKASSPNKRWLESGIVTIRIEEGVVDNIEVKGSNTKTTIPVTYRTNNQNQNYSDYYTFTMPSEDVDVQIRFKNSSNETYHFLPDNHLHELK